MPLLAPVFGQGPVAHTRRMIRQITTGSIATVFPASSELAGQPFSMMEVHGGAFDRVVHLADNQTIAFLRAVP